MPNLEKLEDSYREAVEAYDDDPTDSNRKKFKTAKLKFVEARKEQRASEELDPDHSRGKGVVVITDEEGSN